MKGAQVIDFAASKRARLNPLTRAFGDASDAFIALDAAWSRARIEAAATAYEALRREFAMYRRESLESRTLEIWMIDAKKKLDHYRWAILPAAPVISLDDERYRRGLAATPRVKLTEPQKAALREMDQAGGTAKGLDGRTRFALIDRGLIRIVNGVGYDFWYELTPLGRLVLESGQAASAAKEG